MPLFIVLVGACKWRNRPVGTNILRDLQAKAEILWRHHPFKRVYFALGSKSGFMDEIIAMADAKVVWLTLFDRTPLALK